MESIREEYAGRSASAAVAVFHEYADYAAWRLAPRRPAFEAFVAEVIATWRAAGGEPDVALALPQLLRQAGFRLRSATPLVLELIAERT